MISSPAVSSGDGRRARIWTACAGAPQHPRRAARGRHARSAQPRHQVSRGIRPFAPVVPIEAADRYFELPPGGRDSHGSCRVFSPCDPSGARDWPRSRTWTARPDCKRSSRAWRPGYTLCSSPTDGVAAYRSCSTPRSTSRRTHRQSRGRGYSTFRRSAIDVLVAGRTRVVKRALSAKQKETIACSRSVAR